MTAGPSPHGPKIDEQIDAFRAELDGAVDVKDWERALSSAVDGVFLTALKVAGESGAVRRPIPEGGIYDYASSLREDCDQYLEADPDDFRIVTARHAFDAIMEAQGFLLGGVGEQSIPAMMAQLMLLGARLGHADVMLSMVTTGLWDEFGEAKFKLHNIGSYQRGRQAPWEGAFLPVAQQFCEKAGTDATFGAVVRRANRWFADEKKQGRHHEFPTTEDGIKAGVRRMEKRGDLVIPGRRGG